MAAEASRKPLSNDVLFEILRDLNPTPEQLKEIEVLEKLMLARKRNAEPREPLGTHGEGHGGARHRAYRAPA